MTEAQRDQALARFVLLRSHAVAHGAAVVGLARPARRERGRRTLPGLLVLLIEGLALRRPPPSVATIHRTVADIALEQDWPVPSYSTVYAIVAVLNPGLRTLGPAGH